MKAYAIHTSNTATGEEEKSVILGEDAAYALDNWEKRTRAIKHAPKLQMILDYQAGKIHVRSYKFTPYAGAKHRDTLTATAAEEYDKTAIAIAVDEL